MTNVRGRIIEATMTCDDDGECPLTLGRSGMLSEGEAKRCAVKHHHDTGHKVSYTITREYYIGWDE